LANFGKILNGKESERLDIVDRWFLRASGEDFQKPSGRRWNPGFSGTLLFLMTSIDVCDWKGELKIWWVQREKSSWRCVMEIDQILQSLAGTNGRRGIVSSNFPLEPELDDWDVLRKRVNVLDEEGRKIRENSKIKQ